MCYFWAQMNGFRGLIVLFMLAVTAGGCANISTLPGGKKDTQPPKLVSVSPKDSMLNTRVTKLELKFNEFINVSDAAKEVVISPILPIPISVTGAYKKVTVKIDDTLLQDNTTYRISFGKAIKDLHEGNAFSGYSYTFSTGSYFDSLEISGEVTNAVTGMPDSGSYVLLYNGNKTDSAVLREKPLYVGKVENGRFSIKGLPGRNLRIFALRDANENLVYDGLNEWIAFTEKTVRPGDSNVNVSLRIFPEAVDTAKFSSDSLRSGRRLGSKAEAPKELSYTLNVDTTNKSKRTKDVTTPIEITFNNEIDSINAGHIGLYLDTTDKQESVSVMRDSIRKNVLLLHAQWKQNTLYTLKLKKGFAKDTSGHEAMPSKYAFRTQDEDDYGKLNVHLPAKYLDKRYLLLIKKDKDTVHLAPVTDTIVKKTLLKPGTYTMLVIDDANGNGKWDTGDLLAHRQPEMVIPYMGTVSLKAGWENNIDFEPPKKPRIGAEKEKGNEQKRK